MRIAYLILAHNNYAHLQRLIDALNEYDSGFYIHIDKKSELPEIKGDNIIFIENRVKVYWSTFSEVQATLNLMEKAILDTRNSYFVLLSGADYPVKSNNEIIRRLSHGGEFIQLGANYYPRKYRFVYYYFDGYD